VTKYRPRIDTGSVVAIDMHVHVEKDAHGCLSLDQELMDASAAYFRSADNRTPTVADLAARYRSANMAAVVFTVDAGTATGHAALSSEEIATQAAEHADVLIPFGSVDPHRGVEAVDQARRLVEEFGVILAHPSVPWQSEAIAMAVHKANVFIDLSGWSPKYFPAELVRAAGGMLRRKVLFGSDYPLISPERWIDDFATLGVREEALPGILKGNAIGVLGLG
jgi:predicted TIM-barrel fold metal-dependent hydrolase